MARIGIAGDFCNTSVLEGIKEREREVGGEKIGMAEVEEGEEKEAKDIREEE